MLDAVLASLFHLSSLRLGGEASESTSQHTAAVPALQVVRRPESAPVVSVNTYCAAGAWVEADGQTGVAHLLEHLAFKGTPRIGSRDWKAESGLLRAADEGERRSSCLAAACCQLRACSLGSSARATCDRTAAAPSVHCRDDAHNLSAGSRSKRQRAGLWSKHVDKVLTRALPAPAAAQCFTACATRATPGGWQRWRSWRRS